MKTAILLSLLSGLLGLAACPVAAATRPNILLVYTDDHGWADLGAQGVDGDICTPHLDQLARDGVRFTRGYVTAPQCTPSRAGVISGRYQQRFGVEHNGLAMQQEVLTLPERLKAAGYISGISGKWHLDIESVNLQGRKNAARPELAPCGQGFDEYFTGSMQDYSASHALDGTPFADAPHKVRDERFRVTIQTDAALSFLERRAKQPDQPWFLYVACMAPHVPLESPEPWFSRTPATLPKVRRQALAMIAALDDGLGRIREKLRAVGAEKNTLIFFIGDNGAPLGAVWDGSLNLPLKGQKGMLSEGGIRTPFVVAWPGTIPGGQVYEHPVISLDVAATAVALAGQPHDNLDGVNLMPFLTGADKSAPHATLYWRWMSQAAIQEFPYKLIVLGDRQRLLFDITRPEGENIERNLMKTHPAIAARLEGKLQTWCATLQPPGFSKTFDAHHEGLFAVHNLIAETAGVSAAAAPAGSIQGWLCRNGTLAIKDGALAIMPDAQAAGNVRPFITRSGLDLPGPVNVVLRVRAQRGGQGAVTWRTKQQADFVPANTRAFDWPTAADWQDVKVELPAEGRLIHLRIMPAPGSAGLEIQSIALCGKGGQPQTCVFGQLT